MQILLYEGDPDMPCPQEIAKVTDYIVAYQTKGNESHHDEIQKLKSYIVNLDSDVGRDAKSESMWLARKVMNLSVAHKVVLKQ